MDDIHLSVVATSRNDNHGGDLLDRMQLFIDGLADQADRHRVTTELIIVEWNPPTDRAPLADVLSYPDGNGRLTSRIVTVPPAVHRRFDPEGALPLFQMIAKNVGLRRARGRFVVATNIDILFSDPLMAYLALPLEARTVYRVDRVDIDIPKGSDLDAARAATQGTPVRICRKDGVYVPGQGRILPQYQSVGDFVGFRAREWWEQRRHGSTATLADSGESKNRMGVVERLQDRAEALRALVEVPRLHGSACGDFTLMDRACWETLRGYPEWPIFSWNIDTVVLFQAAAFGFDFVELPSELAAFHMDHETGSGWTPDGRDVLFRRIEAAGIKYLRDADLRHLALEAIKAGKDGHPPVYNDPEWGLVGEDLPDTDVSGRRAHVSVSAAGERNEQELS